AALAQLAFAFGAQAGGLPRPEEYKPFLAMLVNLMPNGGELDALRRAFDQWDVDGYVLARLLLAPLVVLGGVGGWYFFRRLSKRAGWVSLALAAALAGLGTGFGGALTRSYAGAGILSQNIVALLPLLDASLVAGAYLAAGCVAWAAASGYRLGWKGVSASAPLAAIHAGVALMLWGGLMATALNTYSQHELVPEAAGSTGWVKDRHGYTFRLADVRFGEADDGGRRGEGGVRALTTVEVRGARGEIMDGQTLYRDSRSPPERYDGPMRQVCELLDYRYARHVTTPGYLLDPLIDHGWGRSVQFWISPAALAEAAESASAAGGPPVVVAVVKVFPFVSLLWSGLVLAGLGGAWLALLPRRAAAGGAARP
ncbi:cytochrome c-type biogenesis protein CcmF, partial [Thauera linaloolentis 47Lol = DSM 12138]